MPSNVTHFLFGEKALETLPKGLITTREERNAFLLGNQGPDPLFICHTTTYKRGVTIRHLGRDMHRAHMTRTLMCLREGVDHLNPDIQGIGRAYTLGFLGHWLLDSMCHPFVLAEQAAIAAVDESLAKTPATLHSAIESDIDCWLLWKLHHATILDFPSEKMPPRIARVERVMSVLIAYVAQNVFGTTLPASDYAGALNDYYRVFNLIDPVGSPTSKFLSRCELLFRDNSRVLAQGHPVWTSDECPAANLEHRPWEHAASGISGTESFMDLFEAALERYPKVAELLIRGDEDALRAEIDGRDYAGRQVVDA